jgi:hypothetical protein
MRVVIGLTVFHFVLIAAGFGVLRGLGLLPRGWRAAASAVGLAFLAGSSTVVVILIALLVLGMPLSLMSAALVSLACAVLGCVFGSDRVPSSLPDAPSVAQPTAMARRWLLRGAVAAMGAYVAFVAFAISRAPTVGDDARLWSLKGLTLTYYDRLRPEIFQSSLGRTVAHPVYPLFQPVLEALFNRAAGQPELRLFHVELWLLVVAAIWSAAYLLWQHSGRNGIWVAVLPLVVLTPAVLTSVSYGLADATGSVILGVGALTLGLWIDRGEIGHLGLAIVVLAAAASTKDEDAVSVAVVLIAAGVTLAAWHDRARLKSWSVAAATCALLVAPWRIWVAAHHLTDSVTPPLPRSLSPVYVLDRASELHTTLAAMTTQVLAQWGWFAAIFIAVCTVTLITRTARQLTCFYILSVAGSAASLVWLYTTTSISLIPLLRSSMSRTVDIFMALTPFAAAHLLARLTPLRADRVARPTTPSSTVVGA